MNWNTAREMLLDNARQASALHEAEVARWPGIVRAGTSTGDPCLPGYIPYLGVDYFSPRTQGRRILVYAMSQNLFSEMEWVRIWAKSWLRGDGTEALDRQNASFASEGSASMYPFDTGHVPVLCAILRAIVARDPGAASYSIYREIATTNLSKYSFRTDRGRTTDKEASHRRCWEWYSMKEIEILRPDYLLCLGNLVHRVVSEGVAEGTEAGKRPTVLRVAFPSLQVINLHYRRGGRGTPSTSEALCRMLCAEDLGREVEAGHRLGDVLRRDGEYFSRMHEHLKAQIEGSVR